MTDEIQETPPASPNFQTELAAQFADLVPEAITDGKVDVEKLKELLDGDAADSSERFGLFWPGKKRALRAAQEPTTATLKPDFENSKDWDTTQNVFIEGDNLEVLKILQKHYHAKVDLIYIDPPYNTGQDFVYPDNYKEGLASYLQWTQQVNEENKALTTNAETEGRYHSNWLNMMYPRLKLARNLLADSGVVFVSIDDNEIDNLLRVVKEIFGEGNVSTTFIRQRKKKPSFLRPNVGSMTEYVVCATRNKKFTFPFSVDTTTVGKRYPLNNAGNSLGRLTFPAGSVHFSQRWAEYEPQDMSEGNIVTHLLDHVVVKNGLNQNSFTLEGEWRYSQETLDTFIASGDAITISKCPFRPNHLKAGGEVKKMHNLLTPATYGVGTNEDGTAELEELMGGSFFDNPKPSSLIRVLTQAVTYDNPNALVLDFFAGSGTTMDAVLQLNAQDGGNRSVISVQLPEPLDEGTGAWARGFRTISQLAKERIRRAGTRLAASEKLPSDGPRRIACDTGFRAYALGDTSFAKWGVSSDVEERTLQQQMLALRDSATDDASADELLTEILLKQGYSLTEVISRAEVGGLDVRLVRDSDGDIAVLAYLNEHVKPTLEQLRELIDESPTRIIVLEDAFQGDDELKTNLAQLAKSKGIELWTA